MSNPYPTLLVFTSPELLEIDDEHGPRRDEHGEPVPPGSLIADRLQAALTLAGWKCEFRWTTYNSHALDAQRGDNRYDVEVALADRDTARWTISAKPRVGLLRRVFAGRIDTQELTLLHLHIDQMLQALAADGRVTVVAPWAAAED